MSFEIEMRLNCTCGVSDLINISMNDSQESSITEEINHQSSKFNCTQTHPDEIHIMCVKCRKMFNLGT